MSSCVAGDARLKVPLGAADVGVGASGKHKAPEAADGDRLRAWQPEEGDAAFEQPYLPGAGAGRPLSDGRHRQAAFVRAGHEGLPLNGFVHGTRSFGYLGMRVDGPLTRMKKPRTAWAVDPVATEWVPRIFAWYLGNEPGTEPMGYAEIARRLNAEGAPLPPKVTSGRWTNLAVKIVLRNRRYIGDGAGCKERDFPGE